MKGLPAANARSLWVATVVAAFAATLHTFVQTGPIINALMDSNASAESKQGLTVMWNGMSVIAWTYPTVLVFFRNRPATVARIAFGYLALLNSTQALLFAVTGLWVAGFYGLIVLPHWTLHTLLAVLIWLARPPRSAETRPSSARYHWRRQVLLGSTFLFAAYLASIHTYWGTLYSWPAELLTSDTSLLPKLELYVMWLFSCVIFILVPTTLVWSLCLPAEASRFVIRYIALLVASLMMSWTGALVLGFGQHLGPLGPVYLGILVALTALSAPPRSRLQATAI